MSLAADRPEGGPQPSSGGDSVRASLVSLASESHRFDTSELQTFREQGFVIVRSMAADEVVERMLDVTWSDLQSEREPIEFEADLAYPGAPRSKEGSGGRTARRLKQAHSRDVVFTEWVTSAGVVGRIRQVLGPQIVVPLAHHNCVMTKQPNHSSDTGWHQDVRYWSFEQPELVSVWLALGPERQENGSLRVIPGTHTEPIPSHRLDDALFLRADLPENTPIIDRAVDVELDRGDVLFFHSRLFHAASRNRTERPKFSVVYTYRSADNPPIAGSRSASIPELLVH